MTSGVENLAQNPIANNQTMLSNMKNTQQWRGGSPDNIILNFDPNQTQVGQQMIHGTNNAQTAQIVRTVGAQQTFPMVHETQSELSSSSGGQKFRLPEIYDHFRQISPPNTSIS